ncbi:MAG: AtpZ/AtpI family protein [Proteobacteria bacterium]|nr:AtpZ/AtpI family protein [Pseudomonadota bacterium]
MIQISRNEWKFGRYMERNNILGIAFRLGTEFVSAIFVGLLLGYLIDYFLGTKPFGLIIMIILGSLAGFLNVYRASKQLLSDNQKREKP